MQIDPGVPLNRKRRSPIDASTGLLGNVNYGDVIAKGAFAGTIRAWADSIRPVPVFYGHNMDDPDRLITSQIDTAPKSNDAVIEGGAPLRESAQSRHRYH